MHIKFCFSPEEEDQPNISKDPGNPLDTQTTEHCTNYALQSYMYIQNSMFQSLIFSENGVNKRRSS